MSDFSIIVLPIFVSIILIYGLKNKINIYDSFLEGAKEGLIMCFTIFPAFIGMIFAVNIFLESNILISLLNNIIPFLESINIPSEILPMSLLRPISGTATLSIMNDIFITYGPDSFAGRLASILQGCTDTTLYVLLLYFGSVKITKSRYALKVGLFADFIGITLAILMTNIFF